MRSTGKCDIMLYYLWGKCFMKTKIIYISGNEVFDMRDIRAAFEEVRAALNLGKDTVMFGVPVDTDDACLTNNEKTETVENESINNIEEIIPEIEPAPEIHEEIKDIPVVENTTIIEPEIPEEQPEAVAPKKRGRPRKEVVVEQQIEETTDTEIQDVQDSNENDSEIKTNIPILSILSVNEQPTESIDETKDVQEQVDIITEITDDKIEDVEPETINETADETQDEDVEPDLEKLLSEMTPLDIPDEPINEPIEEPVESEPDLSVDATLEQLASEFVSAQDKIETQNKSQSRSKIGKLRNILPFKQSKHKDQGIGDLLEWAGIAANDEDFSVPGFFTNVAAKK